MASQLARTMPGTLELLPREQIAFQRMLDTIRGNYERFGFVPIETPAIEFADVLLTKTGGETERQVYFVESTGALERSGRPELALRFDLTVPLARYVAEHERELAFPFRRYQIQRVYRGERAQRGRFREFYQCDIDVIGRDQLAPLYDAEIPAVIYNVFRELEVGDFTIWLNHRQLLRGFFEGLGIVDGERQTLILREIDKLDKRGQAQVRATLAGDPFNLDAATIDRILALVAVRTHSLDEAMAQLDALGAGSATFEAGRDELKQILRQVHAFGVPESCCGLNLSIARGLDYYTGVVYETTLNDHPEIGSVCSGGRYENLASQYTSSRLPGVGISIGATRLFWQLREAGLLQADRNAGVSALIAHMDTAQLPAYLALAQELRGAGIATEVVLEAGKLARQFKRADRLGVRFVLVLGETELAADSVTIKDMVSNEQRTVARAELVAALQGRS